MLTMVSNCVDVFSWNKFGSGWVCAGGGHHVSDATLEIEYTKRYPSKGCQEAVQVERRS